MQYANTFVVIGGQNGKEVLDTVYVYNHESDAWLLMASKLSKPRSDVAAFSVPQNVLPKC